MAIITNAGESLIASQQAAGQNLVIDKIIFANITGLDETQTPPKSEGKPSAGDIVATESITQTGVVNANTVVYSITMPSTMGTWSFNWMGLYSSAHETVVAIAYTPIQEKRATVGDVLGNVYNKNFAIEFVGAADTTGITIDAQSWQIDYTARLESMDKLQREAVKNIYGPGVFLNDGFQVDYNGSDFILKAGTACVGGLFIQLDSDQVLNPGALPQAVWLDVYQQKTMAGIENTFDVVLNNGALLTDYTSNGIEHSLVKVATLNAANDITNARITCTSFEVWHKGNLGLARPTEYGLSKEAGYSDLENGLDAPAFVPPNVLKSWIDQNLAKRKNVSSNVVGGQWYTVAFMDGSNYPRGEACFSIYDQTSGHHQAVSIYAGCSYGRGVSLSCISKAKYASGDTHSFSKVRIKNLGTYDGTLLQVYVEADVTLFISIYENDISNGWELIEPTNVEPISGLTLIKELDLTLTNGINSSSPGYFEGSKAVVEATQANETTKGAVKLSDATNNSSSLIAASLKAVKAAYDLASGKANASHSHTASDLPNGSTTAKGILQLINSVTSVSTTLAATANAVKTAYDKAVEALNTANSKANASHGHSISDVSGLQSALDSAGVNLSDTTIVWSGSANSPLNFRITEKGLYIFKVKITSSGSASFYAPLYVMGDNTTSTVSTYGKGFVQYTHNQFNWGVYTGYGDSYTAGTISEIRKVG